MKDKINVAVVGLNFGFEFAVCYKNHPMVGELSICDFNKDLVKRTGERLGVEKRFYDMDEVLKDPTIDAVHLLTNIPDHDKQAVKVLKAGKHCASAVPMSLTMEGIDEILKTQKETGKTYMLMETIIFTRNFLYAQSLIDNGTMGKVQYATGAHYQDMEGWPRYWRGMPPMYYASHALAPAFTALKCGAKKVMCLGTGKMSEEMENGPYGKSFPAEIAIFEMQDGTCVQLTRTLYNNARGYTEAWSLGGDNIAFETGQMDDDLPVIYKYVDDGKYDADHMNTAGRPYTEQRMDPPDRLDLIPRELHHLTQPTVLTSETNPEDKYTYFSRGGYHPHVVNEFVVCVATGKQPYYNAARSAALTAACICAHESAVKGGEPVNIPVY
ncbi:Gfo/Idh/MocA family protein [Faecalicatena contorta]|uniref:Gfo/Idh/MocA family protein n=1 Tax=Faecalicatena contorta TaxID=39482 RepID=UPI00321788EE